MGNDPFGSNAESYDRWYDSNQAVYESELETVKELLPPEIARNSIEIGAGTGRFASVLGISYGLDPSERMLEIAGKRGIGTIRGIAEELPLKSSSLRLVLMVTSLCFVDIEKSLREIYRVLVPEGELIIAFIERNSLLGKEYQRKCLESDFYRNATFYSASELIEILSRHGFHGPVIRQTLFRSLSEVKVVEYPEEGFGKGSFVAIRTRSIKKNEETSLKTKVS
jgi:ubiquinone/menaquinone biosynthesis C-methylase UbiE